MQLATKRKRIIFNPLHPSTVFAGGLLLTTPEKDVQISDLTASNFAYGPQPNPTPTPNARKEKGEKTK